MTRSLLSDTSCHELLPLSVGFLVVPRVTNWTKQNSHQGVFQGLVERVSAVRPRVIDELSLSGENADGFAIPTLVDQVDNVD